MEGFLDYIGQNPEILAGIFFFLVAGAALRFLSGWLVKAGAVLIVLVLLGVVSSDTAKGWALDTLEAGADFMVEAFDRVVLDEDGERSPPEAGPAPPDSAG